MKKADAWSTLSNNDCLLGVPTDSRFFAVDTNASPVRGRVHYGYSVLLPTLIFAPLAILAWRTHYDNGVMLFAALAAIDPALLATCQSRIVITDDTVRVIVRRVWRKRVLEEPRSNYVALRYRLMFRTVGKTSWTGHVLWLEHDSRPERSLPVFWSTDFADVARWQTRLATALGVATTEIAGGGTHAIAPADIERPLAEKSPAAEVAVRTGTPPAELSVECRGDHTDIALPNPPRRLKGAMIAAALLAPPAAIALMVIRLPDPALLLAVVALAVVWTVLADGVSRLGSTQPRQLRRLSLSSDGLSCHWRGWMLLPASAHPPWHRILAVEIGPGPWGDKDVLTIRTAAACYTTPPGLSRPALEWMAAAIIGAAQGRFPA